jgi:lipoprotein-anchoring transpeptidase ErfK/SrfK
MALINQGDHSGAAIRPCSGLVRARHLALAAGVAAAVLMTGSAAEAQLFDGIFSSPYRYRPAPYQPAQPLYRSAPYQSAQPPLYRPKSKRVETAKKEPAVKPPAGPLLIAVSLNSQRLTVYANGAPIAHSPVSTGTASNPTPTGIFSIIQKNRHHRSNLYSNAPMPYMQRITWSGVALHQGVLPGYPASHGCIRLPQSFASYLWGTTRIGTGARVIITREEVTPAEFTHAKLFVHKPKQDEDVVAQATELAPTLVKIAETDGQTASDVRARVINATEQAMALKGSLDMPAAAKPAAAGRVKAAAATEAGDRIVDSQTPSRTATDMSSVGTAAGDAVKSGRPAAEAREKPRMSEAVSVFISRKAGRLYVRQGYEPVFEAPVTIQDPDTPLGTHLFTAIDFTDDQKSALRWSAVTVPSRTVNEPERVRGETKEQRNARHEHAARAARATRHSSSEALERIEIAQETVDRISELVGPGASLIISDYPISGETGKYTDFIVLTR